MLGVDIEDNDFQRSRIGSLPFIIPTSQLLFQIFFFLSISQVGVHLLLKLETIQEMLRNSSTSTAFLSAASPCQTRAFHACHLPYQNTQPFHLTTVICLWLHLCFLVFHSRSMIFPESLIYNFCLGAEKDVWWEDIFIYRSCDWDNISMVYSTINLQRMVLWVAWIDPIKPSHNYPYVSTMIMRCLEMYFSTGTRNDILKRLDFIR